MLNNISDTNLLQALSIIVGETYVITDKSAMALFLQERRGRFQGDAFCVIRPKSVEEIVEIVKLAYKHNIKITPQGGNTGLVGGSQPQDSKAIIISLNRLNSVRELDAFGNIVTVEAGVILDNLQSFLKEHKLSFPLHLAASGSCQIGGMLATNAGGVHVIAHGNMRDLCLGIEVVLPTGEVMHDLRYVRKDNSGYNLKDLFIGSEGTLGIITAASLRVVPIEKHKQVAMIGVESLAKVQQLFAFAQTHCGEFLKSFELMSASCVGLVLNALPHLRNPLELEANWYILIELSTTVPHIALSDIIAEFLQTALEQELVIDAAIAQNLQQEKMFWQIREEFPSIQANYGASIKHDISVPLKLLPQFVEKADNLIEQMAPGARILCFGHMGDGNLHYDILNPIAIDPAEFLGRWDEITRPINELASSLNGSFAAEHGVGKIKKYELDKLKDPTALNLMRQLKALIDSKNIMNPGVMLD